MEFKADEVSKTLLVQILLSSRVVGIGCDSYSNHFSISTIAHTVIMSHDTCWLVSFSVLVAQSCLTLFDPMDCSPPYSSVHGILQARILEWVAIPFSRGSFPTQGSNPSLLHCRWILYYWTTREAPGLVGYTLKMCLYLQFWGALWGDRMSNGYRVWPFSKIEAMPVCGHLTGIPWVMNAGSFQTLSSLWFY